MKNCQCLKAERKSVILNFAFRCCVRIAEGVRGEDCRLSEWCVYCCGGDEGSRLIINSHFLRTLFFIRLYFFQTKKCFRLANRPSWFQMFTEQTGGNYFSLTILFNLFLYAHSLMDIFTLMDIFVINCIEIK